MRTIPLLKHSEPGRVKAGVQSGNAEHSGSRIGELKVDDPVGGVNAP